MAGLRGRTALAAAAFDTLSRVLTILLSVVYARALGPHAMGLLAAAQLLPSLLVILSAVSETAALVRRPGIEIDGQKQAHAAALLRLLTAAACIPVAWLAGPPMLRSILDGGPDLARARLLLWILMVGLLLDALGAFPRILLQWNLRVRQYSFIGLLQVATHCAISLVVILTTRSLEALCASVVVSQAVGAGSAWLIASRAKATRCSLLSVTLAWRSVVGQYGRLLASTALGYINARLDNYLVGATLGATSMAFYSLAWTGSRSLGLVLNQTFSNIVLPVLAADGPGSEDFVRHCGRVIQWSLWAVVLAAAVLWVLCDPLLPMVLGDRWLPALLPLRIMLLSLVISVFGANAQTAIIAEGHGERLGFATSANFLIVLIAVPSAARHWGLVGAAFVDVAATSAVAAVLWGASPAARRALRSIPTPALAKPIVVPLVAAAAALAFHGADRLETLVVRTAILLGVGALSVAVFAREVLVEAVRSLRRPPPS